VRGLRAGAPAVGAHRGGPGDRAVGLAGPTDRIAHGAELVDRLLVLLHRQQARDCGAHERMILRRLRRVGLAMRFSIGHFRKCDTIDAAVRLVQEFRLLDRRELAHLFPDATIIRERVMGVTKSLVAVRGLPLPH
jgi:hypothetical protein